MSRTAPACLCTASACCVLHIVLQAYLHVCVPPAGKHLEDAQRTLEQYGIRYWHNKFPHWPLKIRRH